MRVLLNIKTSISGAVQRYLCLPFTTREGAWQSIVDIFPLMEEMEGSGEDDICAVGATMVE